MYVKELKTTKFFQCQQHIILKKFTPFECKNQIWENKFYRSPLCSLLISSDKLQEDTSNNKSCKNCLKYESTKLSQMKKINTKQKNVNLTPAKSKAPISKLSNERLKITLQHYRIENKSLMLHINELKQATEKSSVKVSEELSEDFVTIVSNADQTKMPPFMKFFWDEQQKYLRASPKGIRYHPMIIRYCLSLASKSAGAYDEIRYDAKKGTGFVILPSRRRLRDYKNYIKPQRGFNPEIVAELRNKTKGFSEKEKFIVLLMDEMKIQKNLVWDKHSGELVGYVDLGDLELNYATLPKVNEIATYIMVFLIRSIVNPFKFSLANFATKDLQATQIFPLFWKALSICELYSLKVVALTCDGASPNRKLFGMHFDLTFDDDINPEVDITYRPRNLYSFDEKRFIYFISDVPHLVKTIPNCLNNSGRGKYTRYM